MLCVRLYVYKVDSGYPTGPVLWSARKLVQSTPRCTFIVTGLSEQAMSFILRLAEQMLYCTLPWHKPKKCFKSFLGEALAACNVEDLK